MRANDHGEAELAIKKAREASQSSEPIDLVILGLAALGRRDVPSARTYLREVQELFASRSRYAPQAFTSNTWNWENDMTTTMLLAELRERLPPIDNAPPPRTK